MERREFLKSAAGAVLGACVTSGFSAATPRASGRPLRVNLLREGVPNSNSRLYTFEAARDIVRRTKGTLVPIRIGTVGYESQYAAPIVGAASEFRLDENGYLSANVELHEPGDVRTFTEATGRQVLGVFTVDRVEKLNCLCLHPAGDGAIWPWMKS